MWKRSDHRWTQRRVSDYFDGELSESQRRRLLAHAELCPECGPMLRTLAIMLWELRELRRRAPEVSVVPRVLERLRHEPPLPQGENSPS
jgi:anti-sigma factor RsiW